MSRQGRSNAIVVAAAALVVLCMAVVAEAAVFTVGDANGWTFNVTGWPTGKSFKAGDTLVFNYSAGGHNVVVVDKAGYDSCRAPSNAKVYQTGKDQIKLAKGPNYFICSTPGHCAGGMKIAVIAT